MLGHLDFDLLSWTEKDKAAHPQAASLGAPIEAGDELYTDLQDYSPATPGDKCRCFLAWILT